MKQPSAKLLLKRRRDAQASAAKRKAVAAARAKMSAAELDKKRRAAEQRTTIREMRLAREEAERRARQLQRQAQEQALETEQREAAAAARARALATSRPSSDAARTTHQKAGAKARPAKRRQDPRASAVPALQMLEQTGVTARDIPSADQLGLACATSVLFGDGNVVGCWGEDAGKWTSPQGWLPLVEALNRMHALSDEQPGPMKVQSGEYNLVFMPTAETAVEMRLPKLTDGNGTEVGWDEVVIRITRPDASPQDDGSVFYRYKRLEAINREVFFALHGAAHGYAPECLAVVLFPAVVVSTPGGAEEQRYGTLFVLRRALVDAHALINERIRCACESLDATTATEKVQEMASRVVARILPTIHLQSRLGVVNFDSKPSNFVFGKDAMAYAIDFDASLNSIMKIEASGWECAMLVNLILLTAHIRCYRTPTFADAWCKPIRSLVLELCARARSTEWLTTARVVKRCPFHELLRDTAGTARRRFEMVASIYFVQATSGVETRFVAQSGPTAPSLLAQLVFYCFHGGWVVERGDAELDAALGVVRTDGWGRRVT